MLRNCTKTISSTIGRMLKHTPSNSDNYTSFNEKFSYDDTINFYAPGVEQPAQASKAAFPHKKITKWLNRGISASLLRLCGSRQDYAK